MTRRRILWIAMLACLAVPLVLYALLPLLAAAAVQHLLRQQGYTHISVQLGYPGWRTLSVPLLSFQTDIAAETLAISAQHVLIAYDLWALLSGRVERLTIPSASMSWRSRDGRSGQPCASTQTATTEPGRLAQATVAQLVRPVPALPVRALVVQRLHVFRECATGPLRDVLLTATIQQSDTVIEGSIRLRSTRRAAYRLQFAVRNSRSIDATLHTDPPAPDPIAVLQAHVRQDATGIHLAGQTTLDAHQLARLLALGLPIRGELQEATGSLRATWTATAPPASALITSWRAPATRLAGTVDLALRLPTLAGIGDDLSIRLQGEVTGNAPQLAWTLARGTRLEVELARAPLPLPHALQWLLPTQDRRVVLECLDALHGRLRLTEVPLSFEIAGPVRAQYGAGATSPQIEVVLRRMAGQHVAALSAVGTYRLAGAAEAIAADPLTVQHGQWDLRGTFSLDKTLLQGTVEAASAMHVTGLSTAALAIPTGAGQFTRPVPFSVDLNAGQWEVGTAHVALQIPRVVWQDMTTSMEPAHLTLHALRGEPAHWQASGALRLSAVVPQLSSITLPATQWDADFSVENAVLRLEVSSTAFSKAITLLSRLEYSLAARTGAVHLQLRPVQFGPAPVSWKTLVPLPQFPLEVTGGRLAATAFLTWGPEASPPARDTLLRVGSATLTLEDVSGHYQNIMFEGLTTTLQFQTAGAHTLSMPSPARVAIATVQTGVDVTDVSLDLQLGWQAPAPLPWVALRQMSAAVCGGRVRSEGLRFDAAQREQTFVVQVEQLDLQQLLRVEQQKGLEGTGLLDGVIPVRLTSTGVQVQDGALAARPPGGVLRYRPATDTSPGVTASDTPLAQVVQVLSDFHYDDLKIGLQYAEDGTLTLATRLEGQNPNWQRGQKVHFNLQIEDNIPKLLQSLRIVKGIERSLEERLQRR